MSSSDYLKGYNQSHALIIGINDYQYATNLGYARTDAEELAKVLASTFDFPEKNINLLIDKEATQNNINKTFLEFANGNSKPDDRLIFFFAGHGLTRMGARGEVGYLVPHDGNPDDFSTLIRWDKLTMDSELIAAKHIFFIMDACYGGLALTRSVSQGSRRFYEDMMSRYSRQVLTAGKADQVVSDSGGPRPNHSVFTGHLLDGLEGAATDSEDIITAGSLMSYVYDKVSKDYESNQTPHYGFLDGDGDFIFNDDIVSKDKNKGKVAVEEKAGGSLKEIVSKEAKQRIQDEKRTNILKSKEGVTAAKEEGKRILSIIEEKCDELSHPKAGIVFGFEKKHLSPLQWEIKIYVLGSSAYIKFYIPFVNSTRGIEREQIDDAFIRYYFANFNMFDSYLRIKEEDKRNSENYFYFNMSREKKLGWSTEKRKDELDFSTAELAELLLTKFYKFANKYRDS